MCKIIYVYYVTLLYGNNGHKYEDNIKVDLGKFRINSDCIAWFGTRH